MSLTNVPIFKGAGEKLQLIECELPQIQPEDVVGKQFTLKDAQQAFEYAVQFKPLRLGVRID